MVKLYTDAAVKGNPGPAACGILITGNGIHLQLSRVLGVMDNHTAELAAILAGLETIEEKGLQGAAVLVYSDSKAAIQAIDKNYSRDPQRQALLDKIQQKTSAWPLVLFQWIPEKQNRGADQLARQKLHAIRP